MEGTMIGTSSWPYYFICWMDFTHGPYYTTYMVYYYVIIVSVIIYMLNKKVRDHKYFYC